MSRRGFFGIGIERTKTPSNVGTLWRTAYQLGAAFIFTIGARYRKQPSDTIGAHRKIPLYNFDTLDELVLPYDCPLVGIEHGGQPLSSLKAHPKRAVYLLGAEDHGLTREARERCHRMIAIDAAFRDSESMNVAVAGGIVLWHRHHTEVAP